MNSTSVLMWAGLGLTAGAVLAPAAAALAGVPHRGLYRLLVSLATAISFAALAQRYPVTPALLGLTVFAAVGVLLAAVDVMARRLPRALAWPTCVAVTAFLLVEAMANDAAQDRLLRAVAAAATLAGGYLVVALASRGGLGAGDVRAAVLVGGVLGWHGWPALFTGTVLGFLATGAICTASTGRDLQRAAIPHGPGMLAGALVALLL